MHHETLDKLNIDSTIEGKQTAVKYYAEKELFKAKDNTPVGNTVFCKSHEGNHWKCVCDTHGTLRFPDTDTQDRLVITSEVASREYLDYLRSCKISYIATGKGHIDLAKAVGHMSVSSGAAPIQKPSFSFSLCDITCSHVLFVLLYTQDKFTDYEKDSINIILCHHHDGSKRTEYEKRKDSRRPRLA